MIVLASVNSLTLSYSMWPFTLITLSISVVHNTISIYVIIHKCSSIDALECHLSRINSESLPLVESSRVHRNFKHLLVKFWKLAFSLIRTAFHKSFIFINETFFCFKQFDLSIKLIILPKTFWIILWFLSSIVHRSWPMLKIIFEVSIVDFPI